MLTTRSQSLTDEKILAWLSVATAAAAMTLVAMRELNAALTSPLVRMERLIYAFSIPFTLIGTTVPIIVIAWLSLCVTSRKRRERELSLWRAVRIELDRNSLPAGAALVLWAVFLPIYLLIEDFAALSVVPLTTPICAILAVPFAWWMFRRLQTAKRLIALGLLLLALLSTEYIDWNPRKSMMRDLYSLHVGMTARSVKRTMDGHLTGYGEPDDVEKSDGRLVYITGRGGSYNADIATITFHDGRVTGVAFSHD